MIFKKLPPPEERKGYLLRCPRCGRQAWYVVDLAARGFRCDEGYRGCKGLLVCAAMCKGEPPEVEPYADRG